MMPNTPLLLVSEYSIIQTRSYFKPKVRLKSFEVYLEMKSLFLFNYTESTA